MCRPFSKLRLGTLAQAVQIVKSLWVEEMFQRFPWLREQLWGGELWGDGISPNWWEMKLGWRCSDGTSSTNKIKLTSPSRGNRRPKAPTLLLGSLLAKA